MRIAHIANLYGPESGGLRTTVDALSSEYVALGHEVLIITPGEKDTRETNRGIIKVTIKSPQIPWLGGYRIIFRLRRAHKILQEFSPDVIEISDRLTLLPLAYLGRKAGCNVYLFAHERLDKVIDAFLPRLRTIGFLVKAWNKISVLCVDAVIATTKMASLEFLEIDKYMRKHGRVLRQIPLGVNLEMFVPLRSGNDVAGYLFACTRFSKEKDPIFLIEIMREIKNLGRDIRLKVAGSGPMLDEFKNQVVAEDLPIDLLGFVREKEELNSLMSHASIFLAVGPIETFGLAALECLASGTPVICRDTSAIVEIIDFNSGMSASRSAKQWSNLIIEILDGDRFLWSTGARRRAENFSWTTTASRLLSLSQRDLLRQ